METNKQTNMTDGSTELAVEDVRRLLHVLDLLENATSAQKAVWVTRKDRRELGRIREEIEEGFEEDEEDDSQFLFEFTMDGNAP